MVRYFYYIIYFKKLLNKKRIAELQHHPADGNTVFMCIHIFNWIENDTARCRNYFNVWINIIALAAFPQLQHFVCFKDGKRPSYDIIFCTSFHFWYFLVWWASSHSVPPTLMSYNALNVLLQFLPKSWLQITTLLLKNCNIQWPQTKLKVLNYQNSTFVQNIWYLCYFVCIDTNVFSFKMFSGGY
jgi:hypothetical protein